MLKHFLIFLSLFISIILPAQDDHAEAFYKEGAAAFKNLQFSKADSFYTLSLRIAPHPDTYFNRAMARLKLDNKTGYFEDLMAAGILGDQESKDMFKMQTVRTDTLWFTTKITYYNFDSTATEFHYIVYTFRNMAQQLELKYTAQNTLVNVSWNKINTTEPSLPKENAEFRGGLKAMMTFIQRNLNYPKAARENKIQGKVILQFIINAEGCIERIAITQGVENCEACDKEAVRIVNAMPRWNPAKIEGKAVKTYFSLPISFKYY